MNKPRPSDNAAKPHDYKPTMLRGINFGCGTSIIVADGWVNLDNSPTLLIAKTPFRHFWPSLPRWPTGVRFCNAPRLPFSEESVEVVYSSHFLEHLSATAAIKFLHSAYRVLAPGGIIRTVVPDLQILAVSYLDGQNTADEFLDRLSLIPTGRSSAVILRRVLRQGNYHHWMYDYRSLKERLQKVGFVQIRKMEYLKSDVTEISQLDVEGRRYESLYVEARKPERCS